MKKQIYLRMSAGVVIMLWLALGALNAQERNLKTEILVYILPDSLELPVREKGKLNLQRADVKSSSLAAAMARTKTTGIAKAFPDWSDRDSLVSRTDGTLVNMPSFQRVFTLTFDTEAEAVFYKQFVAENNKQTLAQLFTDVRYPRKNNEFFSEKYLDVLRKQGFLE